MPSFEYWLLLHFINYTSYLRDFPRVAGELAPYLKPYFPLDFDNNVPLDSEVSVDSVAGTCVKQKNHSRHHSDCVRCRICVCRYDPRVCKIGDRYFVTWCNGYQGPTIGIAWTTDFKTFHQIENAFLPYNRNGVLFPRKINGNYAMLSRPSDTGHTPFGDIFYSESPDLEFWDRDRFVMGPSDFNDSAWQCC